MKFGYYYSLDVFLWASNDLAGGLHIRPMGGEKDVERSDIITKVLELQLSFTDTRFN